MAQHRVDEPLRAFALPPHLGDGIVHHRVGRDTVEEQELERGEPQRLEHAAVGARERRRRERREDGVHRRTSLHGADDELVRQGAVALAERVQLGQCPEGVVRAVPLRPQAEQDFQAATRAGLTLTAGPPSVGPPSAAARLS